MNAHVTEWLAAYYDGELHGERLRQVENHLQGCPACQAELDELKKLSALLQEAPLPVRQVSPPRFKTQVKLRLPARPAQNGWQRALKAGWLAVPAGAIFVWAFLQTALLLAAALLLVGIPGIPPGLSVQSSSLGGNLTLLDMANFSAAAVDLFYWSVALTTGLAAFLFGWVACWWAYQRHKMNVNDFQSA